MNIPGILWYYSNGKQRRPLISMLIFKTVFKTYAIGSHFEKKTEKEEMKEYKGECQYRREKVGRIYIHQGVNSYFWKGAFWVFIFSLVFLCSNQHVLFL